MADPTDRTASTTSAVFLTDGTGDAHRAASIATALVPNATWRVAALIAPHPSLLTGETGFASPIQSPDEMEDEATRQRTAGAAAASETAASFRGSVQESVVLSGSDATPLVDYARAERLDLIVAPSPVGLADHRVRGGDDHDRDESDDLTRDLLTSSSVPFLAVPATSDPTRLAASETRPTTVLVAVDDSQLDQTVARVVGRLFGGNRVEDHVRFVVAHVDPSTTAIQSIPVSAGLFFANGDDALPHIAEQLDDNAMEAKRVAAGVADDADLDGAVAIGEVGDPAAGILAVANEHHADVLVVGTRDRSWFSRLFEPSVARAVAARARRPVLIVRSDEQPSQR
ncbi:MAG: universal stress protein [Ilumatobacter sp.]|jgi:nucleotide-binding universal stress UspA family protein|uniref:universal stress protein n=1 Tax=Ilumatobacter sp. TaxID=1967498 RepID=UPI003919CBC9